MRYVTMDREYKVATKEHGTVILPKGFFEVRQYENVEEATNALGGEAQLLDLVNSAVSSGAMNGAKALIRNASKEANMEERMQQAQTYARDYTGVSDRGVGRKVILEGVEALRTAKEQGKLDELSKDELLALLAAQLKF